LLSGARALTARAARDAAGTGRLAVRDRLLGEEKVLQLAGEFRITAAEGSSIGS
jgi:hypothetical protein